jgi:DNA-directed RNA polymerase
MTSQTHPTVDDQLQLEDLKVTLGSLKFHERQAEQVKRGRGAETTSGIQLIEKLIPEVVTHLHALISETEGATRRPDWVKVYEALDPAALAAHGLRALMNAIGTERSRTATLKEIGNALEMELMVSDLLESDKGNRRKLLLIQKGHSDARSRGRQLKKTHQKAGFNTDDWNEAKRVRFAQPLYNALLMTGWFEDLEVPHRGTKTRWITVMTDEAWDLRDNLHEIAAHTHPVLFPMKIIPKPWTAQYSGGYFSATLQKLIPAVRHTGKVQRALVERAFRDGTLRKAIDALNTIQETPMRINRPVMELVTWAWEREASEEQGLPLKKFPKRRKLKQVEVGDWDALELPEKKRLATKRRKIARYNRGVDSNVVAFSIDLSTAEELAEWDRFYLPHNMDFRGRVYPVPTFNHQRSDYIKSMIEFGEGRALGERGLWWLKVQLANTGDFDKVSKRSFEERVQWVHDNEEMVFSIGRDPRADLRWCEADKPFSFYAACLEYAAAHCCEDPESFISHLPVAVDGSNSGVQHFSAALRAEEGAHVNLVPADQPRDLYQAVADRVIEAAKTSEEPEAKRWLEFGLGRTTVKRNVMTFGYSSKRFGFQQQIMEDLMDPLNIEVLEGRREANPLSIENDEGRACAKWLAGAVWNSVIGVLPATRAGMDFLISLAGLLGHEGKPLIWRTPDGLPVVNQYLEERNNKIELFLFDQTLRVDTAGLKDKVLEDGTVLKRTCASVMAPKDGHTVNKNASKNAVAPNVIHSMDATHLRAVVRQAHADGIGSVLLIHDSFATHASELDGFAATVRKTFVEQYRSFDLFEELAHSAEVSLSVKGQAKLPPLPQKGNLALERVVESVYSFA